MKRLLQFFIICLILPFSVQGSSLKEVMGKAANYFSNSAEELQSSERVVVNVVNLHSQKKDDLASKIETELYFALQQKFPGVNLVLEDQALSGVTSQGTIFIFGEYEQKGQEISVTLKALEGLQTGKLITQLSVEFESNTVTRKALVAVLPIEASMLNKELTNAYSEIYTSTLISIGTFDVASSAEVAKMDPDEIQRVQSCTRDECATIIGEQLGVDRVISTTVFEIKAKSYVLSGKIIDIKDGSIIKSVTEAHKGDVDDMENSLKSLARKLADIESTNAENALPEGTKLTVLFPFKTADKIADETAALDERFRQELPKTGQLHLIELERVESAMEELGFKKSGCGSVSCATQVGNKVEASQAIVGKVLKISDMMWMVSASLINTNSGKMIHSDSVRHKGDFFDLLEKGMPQLVGKLFGSAPPPPINVGTTQLGIVTFPPGANIFIDGQPQKQKSNAVIKGIAPGKHTIRVLKDNLGGERPFVLEKGGAKNIELHLRPVLAKVKVTSNPQGATVFLDGKRVGVTPTTINSLSGVHKIRLQKRGSREVNENIRLRAFKTVSYHKELSQQTQLKIEIIPSYATLMVNGRRVGFEHAETKENTFSSRIETMDLAFGVHQISLSHPNGLNSPVTRSIQIKEGDGLVHEKIQLDINTAFLGQKNYEDQLSSWKSKWITSFIGSALLGVYAASEQTKAEESATLMKEEEELMLNSGSKEEAEEHFTKVEEHQTTADKHNTQMRVSGALSGLLFTVTLWRLLNPPDKPGNAQVIPLIVDPQRATLSYQVRW